MCPTSIPTANQVSAGGVAYRKSGEKVEVVLILVGPNLRWQLPKGAIRQDEQTEAAAQREVREETGLSTELHKLIDKIEYWFYVPRGGSRTRIHKVVYFYLMRFVSGDVKDHDDEVEEARWIEIDQAIEMLAFNSEKEIIRKAKQDISSTDAASGAEEG